MLELSDGENYFIINGIDDGVRIDGRDVKDYRPIDIEVGTIINANGSARIRLGNTEVITVVKAELMTTSGSDKGKIKFNLDFSAIASPMFQGKGVDDFEEEVCSFLEEIFKSNQVFNIAQLVVLENQYFWALNVEILIIEYGGNIYDMIALAVKSALYNTKLPIIKISYEEDLLLPYIELPDNPSDELILDVNNVPLIITVFKIGSSQVVDASMEEESCAIASLICAISPHGNIISTKKVGGGSLNPISLQNMIKTAAQVGVELNETLMGTLKTQTEKTNIS